MAMLLRERRVATLRFRTIGSHTRSVVVVSCDIPLLVEIGYEYIGAEEKTQRISNRKGSLSEIVSAAMA